MEEQNLADGCSNRAEAGSSRRSSGSTPRSMSQHSPQHLDSSPRVSFRHNETTASNTRSASLPPQVSLSPYGPTSFTHPSTPPTYITAPPAVPTPPPLPSSYYPSFYHPFNTRAPQNSYAPPTPLATNTSQPFTSTTEPEDPWSPETRSDFESRKRRISETTGRGFGVGEGGWGYQDKLGEELEQMAGGDGDGVRRKKRRGNGDSSRDVDRDRSEDENIRGDVDME